MATAESESVFTREQTEQLQVCQCDPESQTVRLVHLAGVIVISFCYEFGTALISLFSSSLSLILEMIERGLFFLPNLERLRDLCLLGVQAQIEAYRLLARNAPLDNQLELRIASSVVDKSSKNVFYFFVENHQFIIHFHFTS